MYTTGDVAAAVRFFLGLLRRPPGSLSSRAPPSANGAVTEGGKITSDDKMFLDDFRVAFAVGQTSIETPYVNYCIPAFQVNVG